MTQNPRRDSETWVYAYHASNTRIARSRIDLFLSRINGISRLHTQLKAAVQDGLVPARPQPSFLVLNNPLSNDNLAIIVR
jgi:hypothetical protein